MKSTTKILIVALFIIMCCSTNAVAGQFTYTVQAGDSLWQIARDNDITVEYLMQLNNLSSEKLQIGDVLLVKMTDNLECTQEDNKSNSNIYTVRAGECLGSIAEQYNMTVAQLMEINHLDSDKIKVGQQLSITEPEQNCDQLADTGGENDLVMYQVKQGDCLASIARTNFMTVEQLRQLNSLAADASIFPGDELLVKNFENVSRGGYSEGQRIINTAANYLGVPYRYGGASPSGFDCSGFVQYIYRQFGYDLPHVAAAQYNMGIAVSRNELLIGDLVFFSCGSSGIDHVGIYAGNQQFIHSSSPRSGGVIYSSLDEGFYARTYAGAARILR